MNQLFQMKKSITFLFFLISCLSHAVEYDMTLRLDYIFSGTAKSAEISLDMMHCIDGWAGRRTNMDKVPLRGNGMIIMTDAASGKVLYMQSFSTLFQEWQTTEEATRIRKAFENVFLVPMPESPAFINIEIYDVRGNISASHRHLADPSDILIRKTSAQVPPHRYIQHKGSSADCIDIAVVAEGYTPEEHEKFYAHAQATVDAILSHEPFGQYAERFNFVAVALESQDSGVSVPEKGEWKNTPLGSNFSTFYSSRYLTTRNLKKLHDALSGIPYEHIIILANTDTYGGGGIYNSYTLTTTGHQAFKPVVVHEFGHSFAGLADEYYYDDQYTEFYYPDVEPWEQNITTMHDFDSKWKDMLDKGEALLLEGAGYQSKGVFRGSEDCRMHTNKAPEFCPVCRRAISRLIEFYL